LSKSEPDFGLLKRAQAGETEALEDLYARFGKMVFGTAFGLMTNVADAEDVLQDVFLGLPAAIGKYQGSGSFEGWLRKVTARTSLMRLRKMRRRGEVSIDRIAPITAPEENIAADDRLLLETAMTTLTEEQRQVFVLRAIEGYTHAEVGQMLGISSIASRSRFHRAVEHLVDKCRGIG